jgi:hypothetical protein
MKPGRMKPEQLRKEFEVRYYLWALDDSKREIEQGFPFLRTFKSGSIWHAVRMMSGMSEEGKHVFARALVKRFHKSALLTLGEAITRREEMFLNQYREQSLMPIRREVTSEQRRKYEQSPKYGNRRTLTRLVKNELAGRGLQLTEEEDYDGLLKHASIVGDWRILTLIHTRNQYSQLAYDHVIWSIRKVEQVTFEDGRTEMWPIQLGSTISIASWLGLSSQSEWSEVEKDECLSTVQALGSLCTHFLRAAERLFDGLAP